MCLECYRRRESVKRSLYLRGAEESPGSIGSERQVIPGECELTESAAERKPPECHLGKGEKVR